MELYEDSYSKQRHFSFGKNWEYFLTTLNEERIMEAEKSLISFLGEITTLKGKTFVDIGCGSGLFSLAAYRLGATRVVSTDIDDSSLACATRLREQQGNPHYWEIHKGSALDSNFIRSLGTFDIVYSWGVLHHTGDMYTALHAITSLPSSRGVMFIALYNDNRIVVEGTSAFWVKAKRAYNQMGGFYKKLTEGIYIGYYIIGLIVNGRNPYLYITQYRSLRGMNFMTDIRDWLGGHPYEYASPETIISFFKEKGFKCIKINPARSIGCNEFLLVHEKQN